MKNLPSMEEPNDVAYVGLDENKRMNICYTPVTVAGYARWESVDTPFLDDIESLDSADSEWTILVTTVVGDKWHYNFKANEWTPADEKA